MNVERYESGLNILQNKSQGTPWHSQYQILATRLQDNLDEELLFGSSALSEQVRSQTILGLNKLSMKITGTSFTALCEQQTSLPKSAISS